MRKNQLNFYVSLNYELNKSLLSLFRKQPPLKTKSPGELASTETLMKNYLPRDKDTIIFDVATSFSKKIPIIF